MIALSYWAASWGANFGNVFSDAPARIGEVQQAVDGDTEGVLGIGALLIDVGNGFVRLLALAFSYSFFWCAVSAIYLLLRQDVDQTEFDEVWVEDEEQQFGLPPIKPDKAGVPDLADKPKPDSAKDEAGNSASDSDDDKQDSADGDSNRAEPGEG